MDPGIERQVGVSLLSLRCRSENVAVIFKRVGGGKLTRSGEEILWIQRMEGGGQYEESVNELLTDVSDSSESVSKWDKEALQYWRRHNESNTVLYFSERIKIQTCIHIYIYIYIYILESGQISWCDTWKTSNSTWIVSVGDLHGIDYLIYLRKILRTNEKYSLSEIDRLCCNTRKCLDLICYRVNLFRSQVTGLNEIIITYRILTVAK